MFLHETRLKRRKINVAYILLLHFNYRTRQI